MTVGVRGGKEGLGTSEEGEGSQDASSVATRFRTTSLGRHQEGKKTRLPSVGGGVERRPGTGF